MSYVRNLKYLYDSSYYENCLEDTFYCDLKLKYLQYNDAYILPFKQTSAGYGGGVVTKDGIYLENSALHTKNGVGYDFTDFDILDEKVIYLGIFTKTWGHFITDCIRRLWFVNSNYYNDNLSDYKFVYIPFPGFGFSGNYKILLEIMGIDTSVFIPIKKITRFTQVIIPDESFFTLDGNKRYFTYEYKEMINLVREYGLVNKRKINFEKVYFTYRNCSGNNVVGEEKIEKFFKEQGYTIISPERLSFYEQLNILTNCKFFASTVGSCSHNIIFMQDNSNIILLPRANFLTGYQLALDDVVSHNITYIDTSLSFCINSNYPWIGPFYYFISDNLCEFFNIRRNDYITFKENYRGLKRYFKFANLQNNTICSDTLKYYSSEISNYLSNYNKHSILMRLLSKTKLYKIYYSIIQKIKKLKKFK